MPFLVRNNEPNMTVFAKSLKGDPLRIQWGAKGQHDDTQRVPDAIADDIDFLNSLEGGVFSVVGGDPELVRRLEEIASDAKHRRDQARAKAYADAQSTMDRKSDRDLLGATCIGPASSGRSGACGRHVLVSSRDRNETPPLCEVHRGLANEFFLAEEGSPGEGATSTSAGVVRREWRRAQLMPAVRG